MGVGSIKLITGRVLNPMDYPYLREEYRQLGEGSDRSTFHGPGNLYAGDNLVTFDQKYGIQREYTWPEHLAQINKTGVPK